MGMNRNFPTETLSLTQDRLMQKSFDRNGPELDRGTDWKKCMEQPWFDIANALVHGRDPIGPRTTESAGTTLRNDRTVEKCAGAHS